MKNPKEVRKTIRLTAEDYAYIMSYGGKGFQGCLDLIILSLQHEQYKITAEYEARVKQFGNRGSNGLVSRIRRYEIILANSKKELSNYRK